MSGRKPRPDELDLWNRVAKQTNPIHRKPVDTPMSTAPKKPVQKQPDRFSIEPFTMGHAHRPMRDDLAPALSQRLADQPVSMDRKAFRNLRKGRMKPDAKIDLHGMTAERAHTALTRFVLRSHSKGHRLLLVITGKGKHRDDGGPIPVRLGVLRHQVPEWLRLPPLAPAVLQIAQAHVSHGGEGAYYVYLRKSSGR